MVLLEQSSTVATVDNRRRIELSKSNNGKSLLGTRRFSMTFPEKFIDCSPAITPSAASQSTTVHAGATSCRTVILRRCQPGQAWGFSISRAGSVSEEDYGTNYAPKNVVLVTRVTPESPAYHAGLQTDDRILCVNGKDLSQASHEEAVEAFRNAQEPIIVQVARQQQQQPQQPTGSSTTRGLLPLRIPPPPTKPLPAPPASASTVSTAVQSVNLADSQKQPAPHRRLCTLMSAPPSQSCQPQPQQRQHLQHLASPGFRRPLCLSSSSQDLILGDAIEQLYQLADEQSTDYEVVTLHRSSPNERLGLTLCYNRRQISSEDYGPDIADVFVGSIDAGSNLAEAGQIRPGDQILRVNGQPVLTREQTVRLFAEAGQTVSLLLARSGGQERHSPSSSSMESPSNGSCALYDIATIGPTIESQASTQRSGRPSRGHVPRMGIRGLPPPPMVQQTQPQVQPQRPPPPHTQPQKASAASQTKTVVPDEALNSAAASVTEWVVKRRPDGSRYVTRRKAKTRLKRAGGHDPSTIAASAAVLDSKKECSANVEGDNGSGVEWARESAGNSEVDDLKQRERRRRQAKVFNFQHMELIQKQQQQQHLVPVAFV